MELRPHEQKFAVRPVGIRYICEFCNEGEMIQDNSQSAEILMSNPPKMMIPHRCNKCGKTMQLPRSYPYIDWEVEEY